MSLARVLAERLPVFASRSCSHRSRQRDRSAQTRRSRLVALGLALLVLLAPASARADNYEGRVFTYFQPDDTSFAVHLYGDEFYAVAETGDGYVVVQDPESQFHCYALLSDDGQSFVSSSVPVGEPIPAALNLAKHQRLPIAVQERLGRDARTRMGVDDRGRLLPDLRRVLRPDDPLIDDFDTRGPPSSQTTGVRVGLVLLASFPDRPGDVVISQGEVDAYCNDPSYTGFSNATSVHGYFDIQSNGKLQYNLVVTAYFTAAYNRDYYTDSSISYGTRAKELINEGLAVLVADGFDFTSVDGDSNTVIDGVNCFYAGSRVNSWSQGLWPHKWSSSYSGLSGQGVSTSFQYQITDMSSSLALGTFCHENGHMICGFPDLYAYNSNAANLGGYSLMHSSGSTHPRNIDAYLKIHAGWAEVVDMDSSSHFRGGLEVDKNTFYRFRNPSESREYFILSMRTNAGYEGAFGGSTTPVNPTDGLVIYHAREHGSNTYSSIVTADSPSANYTTPYELMVVEANPSSSTTPWYDDPSPGSNDGYHADAIFEASDSTLPALKFWNTSSGRTTASNMEVHTISPTGPRMTFIVGPGALDDPPGIGTTSASLSPVCDFGTNAPAQTFAVFNTGDETLNYSMPETLPSWLSVTPTGGSATTEADLITVTYATNALPAGQYPTSISIVDTAASNSPVSIPVLLTVNNQPTIAVDQASVSLNLAAGETGSESLVLSNTGGGTMSYNLSSPAPWLEISPSSGTVATEQDQVHLTFDASRLLDGVYTTTLTISSGGATNSPATVNVTLNVFGHVIVVSPAGGETLYQGDQAEIYWLTDDSVVDAVNIDLYKNGALNTEIATGTGNDSHFTWTVPAGQAIGTDFTIRVTDALAGGSWGESLADFAVAAVPTAVSIPYAESFEAGFGDWTQAVDDAFDWIQNSGSTPSSATGPTAAQDGTFYVFTESSYPNNPTKSAVLQAVFDLRTATAPLFSFQRSMYGATMGTLDVRATGDHQIWWPLFSLTGDQGTGWAPVTADLSPLAGKVVTIRITGTTGSSYASDMALDNLTINEATKVLSFTGDTFSESTLDNGTIATTIAIDLSGDTFSTDVVSGGLFTVSNTPPGLTPQLVRNSSAQVTLSFTGAASLHTSAENVLDLELKFANGAFTSGDASSVASSTSWFIVNFHGVQGDLFADGFESGDTSAWTLAQ